MIRSSLLATAAAILLLGTGVAGAGTCETAARAYEASEGIPGGLLVAVAQTESGRYQAVSRTVEAWPWTVGSMSGKVAYGSRDEAVAAVRDLQARDVSNIQVGCMQIDLTAHPDAFRSLWHAFDPDANVACGASLLVDDYRRAGNWSAAAGLYHSSDPAHARAYRDIVVARWAEIRAADGLDVAADDPYWYQSRDVVYPGDRFDWPWWSLRYRAAPERPWLDRRGRVVWWYGDSHPYDGSAVYSPGPWRPVGTNRFN